MFNSFIHLRIASRPIAIVRLLYTVRHVDYALRINFYITFPKSESINVCADRPYAPLLLRAFFIGSFINARPYYRRLILMFGLFNSSFIFSFILRICIAPPQETLSGTPSSKPRRYRPKIDFSSL